MLKRLPGAKTQLLKLVNNVWENRTFPDEWRKSHVIPIPKNNMAGRDAIKYRPISRTSCACKTMERMVHRRLRERLKADRKFGFHQHAFRPRYGTSAYFANLGSVLQSVH